MSAPGCHPPDDAPPLAPGIPYDLARDRAARIADLRYDVALTIPEHPDEPVTGSLVAAFSLNDTSQALAFDFRAGDDQVHAVTANGEPIDVAVRNEHLMIPAAALRLGANRIAIDFTAGDGSLNRREDYLYTLFVPDRASYALPVFDQPDLKARFRLTLDVPARWVAVANAPEEAMERRGPRRIYRFAETRPLPTYLFAFAAGDFQIVRAERDGRPMRLFHRETDRARVRRNTAALFDLHAAALRWLEAYTGIPYPFAKFDMVLIPSFQFGGMEHPGSIFYRAESLFLDRTPTQNQALGRASLIAHETAHMWFGNLVTMRWFDDVWMKEVFANFMAARIVNPSFPEIDHALRFWLAHYPAAYDVERTEGTHPIRQPLDNLNEAGSLYGAIIYQKAPIVMQQLERIVGEDAFRNGIRAYLNTYVYGNASWPDLIAFLDARTEEDLTAWSRRWVEEAGRPVIRTERVTAPDGRLLAVRLHQDAPDGRLWTQALTLALGDSSGQITRTLRLHDRVTTVFLDSTAAGTATGTATGTAPADSGAAASSPAYVLPLGYGLMQPDSTTQAWLLEHLPTIPDNQTRAVAWLTLWDGLLEGRIAPGRMAMLLLRALPAEPTELLAQRMLGDLETLYWRYLPPATRTTLALPVEEMLWREIVRDGPASRKAAFFATFRDIATGVDAMDRLYRLWDDLLSVDGLTLSENDRTDLALWMALQAYPGWTGILDAQAARITNPDRQARFAFLRPAVDPDPAVRDSVFASFADPAHRRQENWVLDALRYLNHPLHADHAVRYLRPGLSLVEALQTTGTIFFPRRFLDALFSGHTSPEATAVIRQFLADHPDYPPRLRGKILQAADPVFRAARIRDEG